MPDYDFKELDDKEFELLTKDILEKYLTCHIERFRPGRDGGVDGRFFKGNKETIIQCKHYSKSGFSTLLNSLKKELPKVQRLAAQGELSDYIISTSLPLSHVNKKSVYDIFKDYMQNAGNILGQEDLNDILSQHTEIERKHYKLWLSSTNVLQFFLQNRVMGRSTFVLKYMTSSLRYFVKPSYFDAAIKQLHDKHSLIIVGSPGVGKTTTAEAICCNLVTEGYQFIALENNIAEAEDVYQEDTKQLFYLDDIFGSSYFEAFQGKHDSIVARFIRRVGDDPTKRFILTSRINIINKAIDISSSLSDNNIKQYYFTIDSSHLTRLEKAQILYKRLWYSELSSQYIDAIYDQHHYLSIIDHRNYNPRIIRRITENIFYSQITPTKYWEQVIHVLGNPKVVWEHPFENLPLHSRIILQIMAVEPFYEPHYHSNLLRKFESIIEREHSYDSEAALHTNLRYLTKSFIIDTIDNNKNHFYRLIDPSLHDYLLSRFENHSGEIEWFICTSTTIHSLNLLDRLYENLTNQNTIPAVVKKCAANCTEINSYSLTLLELSNNWGCFNEVFTALSHLDFSDFFEVIDFYGSQYDFSKLYIMLLEKGIVDNGLAVTHLHKLIDKADFDDLERINPLLNYLMKDHPDLATAFLENLPEMIDYYFHDHIYYKGLLDDYDEIEIDEQEAFDALWDYVDEIIEACPIAIQDFKDKFLNAVDFEDILEKNLENYSGGSGYSKSQGIPDAIIHDLFDRSA